MFNSCRSLSPYLSPQRAHDVALELSWFRTVVLSRLDTTGLPLVLVTVTTSMTLPTGVTPQSTQRPTLWPLQLDME